MCPDSTFGETCKFTCGHCYDDEICNHINGSCPSGCASGWSGAICDKGDYFSMFKPFQRLKGLLEYKKIFMRLITFDR